MDFENSSSGFFFKFIVEYLIMSPTSLDPLCPKHLMFNATKLLINLKKFGNLYRNTVGKEWWE